MDFFIELLYVLAHNRFVFLMVAVLLILLMRFLAQSKNLSNLKKKILTKGSSLLLLVALLLFIFGSDFANKLIYDHGEFGEGIVVEKKETGDMYNQEPVIRYVTLVKTEKEETVQTAFDSDHFNLYPELDGTNYYPDVGISFTVKHLKRNPKVFVIITNDDSPYGTNLGCSDVLKILKAAKSKLDFNPDDEAFKNQYRKYNEAYLSSGCAEIENKDSSNQFLDLQKQNGNALPINDFVNEFLLKKVTTIKRPWLGTKWNLPKNTKPSFISKELVGHLLPKIALEKQSFLTNKQEIFHFAKLSQVDVDKIGSGFYNPEHWVSKFDVPIHSYKFSAPLSLLFVKENKSQIVGIDSIVGDRFFTFHPRQNVEGELDQALVPIIYKTQLPEHIDFVSYLTPTVLRVMENSEIIVSVESVAYGDVDYPGTLSITQVDLNGNAEYDIIRIKDDLLDLVTTEEDEGEGFSGDYILVYMEDEWYLSSYRITGFDGIEGY
ncbi:hypothetical protein [Flagellimonas eckloniae]|uniref:hypothetical protein n=1 Tax=Flagellimonas eckloniae TaxID=346185 RepID=UPI0006DC4A0C|nr:hypothetical protein [Allomuricauda eckloniae]